MNYKEILENSYKVISEDASACENKLEYLSEFIFDFTTYDSEMAVLFARKAVEVCAAINNRLTFEYISDPEDYKWFLLMCNMPFFVEKLEWGTSIRGAWWGYMPRKQKIEFESVGMWIGDDQICEKMKFNVDEWKKFIEILIEFVSDEMK